MKELLLTKIVTESYDMFYLKLSLLVSEYCISYELIERESVPAETLVIPKIAEVIDNKIKEQKKYLKEEKIEKNRYACNYALIVLRELKDELSNFSV